MTFVGKVLVVVQLVLAVCFMAFAGAVYTAETNWRAETDKAKADAKRAQDAASTAEQALAQANNNLGGQINALTQRVALLDGQFKTATEQLQRTQQELQDARTAVDRQTAVANLAEDQSKFRQEETLRQRERNERLQNDINDLLAKVRNFEDTLFSKNLQIEQMESRQRRMIDQLSQYKQMVASLGGSPNPEDYPVLNKAAEPPNVKGQILDTRVADSGTEFVVVSLGSDDGFKKGNELSVFRGGEYLGKIELTNVDPDRSVGRVIQRVRNGTVKKGDNVSPRI